MAALPSVTLAVSPASVTEDGTANLVYTFSRSSDTTNALTVNYTIAGTATLGTDYTGIAASPEQAILYCTAAKPAAFAACTSPRKACRFRRTLPKSTPGATPQA